MPYQDGTGPFGDGRMGRGMGPCGRTENNLGMGRGLRKGFRWGGSGFGRRNWMRNEPLQQGSPAYSYDKESLQQEKSRLEKLINWISDRITEMN